MAKIELYEDKAKEWRWRFKAGNGRIMADSGEGYTSQYDCRMAAERFVDLVAQATIVVEETKDE